ADLIRMVTALFLRGDLRIIVGTQSLLGQGWDAPALNSLVLASNTASFMLSNQMRGRAIRIDPNAPAKVANIWHLATLEPDDQSLTDALAASLNWGFLKDRGADAMSDIGVVARRFRAFEGVSNGGSTLIESGLGRLALDPSQSIARLNEATFAGAADREGIADKWKSSLGDGEVRARVRETAAPNYAPRRLSVVDTLHALVWTAGGSFGLAAANQLRSVTSLEGLAWLAMGAAGTGVAVSLPYVFKAARLAWRNGSLEGSLLEVAGAVLEGLVAASIVNGDEAEKAVFEIRSSVDGRKDIIVAGVGRSTERSIMQAIAELLGPIENPRYILVRKSWLSVKSRTDYHAVPTALGTRKEHAEAFAKCWQRRVGSSELVFTRNVTGRRTLLRARARSFAAGFQRSVDRRSAWL
ncbi:MAG: RNA helicase, partial [Pseudomonadota bacterium]